eukprot:1080552-Prymnesium_polylepis.1
MHIVPACPRHAHARPAACGDPNNRTPCRLRRPERSNALPPAATRAIGPLAEGTASASHVRGRIATGRPPAPVRRPLRRAIAAVHARGPGGPAAGARALPDAARLRDERSHHPGPDTCRPRLHRGRRPARASVARLAARRAAPEAVRTGGGHRPG